jgi:hypothetical protein
MLRGAQILDDLGDYQNSDRLIAAAINSMKRVAWDYDHDYYTSVMMETQARPDVNAYMKMHPSYFAEPSAEIWDGSSYSDLEASHVTSAYQSALNDKLSREQIHGLSPVELNYWAKRKNNQIPVEPNPQAWTELHSKNLDRGSVEYDYYLQIIQDDPVYAQVPPAELFDAYKKAYGDSPGFDLNRTRFNYNAIQALKRLSNNYLIQDDFVAQSDHPLQYSQMELNQNQVDKVKMLKTIFDRDNPSIYKDGMNGMSSTTRSKIVRQFDPATDLDKNANELIARAAFGDNADQHLEELKAKIAKFYRVSPETYEGYYDLLQILSRNPMIFGVSLKALEKMYGGNTDILERDQASIIKVFNKNWEAWVAKFDGDIHAAAQILPPGSVRELSGLGDFLMRWFGKINNNDIHIISTYWSKLTPEQKQLPPKQIAEIANIAKVQKIFENEDIEHVPFAVETAKWWQDHKTVDESEWRDPDDYDTFGEEEAPRFDELQRLFMESQKVPLPEWTQYTAKEGGLTGRFLPRSDVRGLYLGQYSNSCQHPWNMGAECAYHGQSSPHGAFFVVEDKEGNIVAQSWV